MADKPSVIRETDDAARALARKLLRSARYAAIAVIDPETGFPAVSRVLVGIDTDGAAVILVSALSAHTQALMADERCSLLVGEPGKGDPLAHPRLSVQCVAHPVARPPETGANDNVADPAREATTPTQSAGNDDAGADERSESEPGPTLEQGRETEHGRLRRRFLARHPKAALYIDFPDFRFFRLLPQVASLNGGFGRAYNLDGDEFAIVATDRCDFAHREQAALQEVGVTWPDLAATIARAQKAKEPSKWSLSGLDMAGIDLINGNMSLRHEFSRPMGRLEAIKLEIATSVCSIP